MRTPVRVAVAVLVGASTCAAIAGCELTDSDSLATLVRVTEPDRGDTLRVGQPFALEAEVETDGPADSIIVEFRAVTPAEQNAVSFPLEVPEALRSGAGVLSAEIDTTLVLQERPVADAVQYVMRVTAYARGGQRGGAEPIGVIIQ